MSVRSNKMNNIKDDGDVNVREITPLDTAQRNDTEDDLKQDKSGDKAWISSKQESPKDDVQRINPTAKKDAKKNNISKTTQHLLSDWRTAISNKQLNTKVRILFSLVLKSATMHHSLFSGCWLFKYRC